LQGHKQPTQRLLRLIDDLREQVPGTSAANNRQGLQQRFLGWRQPVETRCQYFLDGGWELDHG
jgi:hypothetical protein